MGVLRHLVVVVPGIGGSVLVGPDELTIWDVTAGGIVGNVVDSANLAIDRDLAPMRLVDSLTVLKPWLVIPGYDRLTHLLRTKFGAGLRVADYIECDRAGIPADVDVLRVPYDFRRSVAESAEVLGRAVAAAVGGSGRRVIVVAHSLGGLVGRYWMGACGGWHHTRALITLSTPHRGAPRALDWLFNGAGAGLLRLPGATRVLREWPSTYELLPQYPAVLAGGGEPVEVTTLSAQLVRPFGSPGAGAEVLRRARAAAAVHEDLNRGWAGIPEQVRRHCWPYFGRGHATPNEAVVENGRVRVSKIDPQWRRNVGWRGDGTVPAICAIPAELSEIPDVAQAVADTHGAMGSTAEVLQRLVTMQGEDLPKRGTDRPVMPWVGWDVEEVVAAGTQVEVGAQLQHGAVGPTDVVGSGASIVVSGNSVQAAVPMRWDERGWRAVLPALPAGTYQLDVEVKDAWFGTSVFASSPLAVVDPADGVPA